MKRYRTNLSDELLNKYGPMIGGADLYLALGFKTYGTFRLAKERGEIPIEVFKISKRRDWYALTSDLAQWLTNLAHDPGLNREEMEG
jgi:hypothetical protein